VLSHPPDVRPAAPAQSPANVAGGAARVPVWLLRLADARRLVVLAGLAAAVLLPQATVSGHLPAVRLEQLLLPYALLVFWVDHRLGRRFRLGFLDWIFVGLALSTLVSILVAPLILRTHLSPRDFFELLKLALYWSFYRLARSAYDGGADEHRLLDVLLLAGGLSAGFALFQYFDWLRVNAWLTPLYAPEPHLGVLRQSGRVVGTFANPNYFGIFCAMLLLGCLVAFWLARRPRPGWQLRLDLIAATAALASAGIVMSGSRTALLALAVALGVLLVFGVAAFRRRASFARLAAGTSILVLLLAGSVLLVERFPHGGVDYLGRVGDGALAGDDTSLNLRLARWRSVLDAWLPRGGEGAIDTHVPLTSVHSTGVTPASADALARDGQRKQDLLAEAVAIDAYHRATGAWPSADALQAALVPRYLPALPLDPSTHQPYPDIPTVTGYSLMARLENPADPDFPIYGIGSSPNYLLNGDLEQGGSRPQNWDGIPGSAFAREGGDALYGDHTVLFRGNLDHPEQRAGIYQQRYFGRPGGHPFTATVWVKLLGPSSGTLELYANAIYDDGSRADPLTRIPADMSKDGVWQKVSLGILPPAGKTLAFLGVYVVSEQFQGQALLDGFQLVDGTVPLDFAITREAPPSDTLGFNPEAKLSSSPLIGVGPEKGEQGSALDDEYLLYAARYGLIGILLYLTLYLGTLALAVHAFLRGRGLTRDTRRGGRSERRAASSEQQRGEGAPVSLPPDGDSAHRGRETATSRERGQLARPGVACTQRWERVGAALVALTLVAFLVFNITAGSFYELQLMAIFWLLAGAALRDEQRANPAIGAAAGAEATLEGS
jgi:hypothetical protein